MLCSFTIYTWLKAIKTPIINLAPIPFRKPETTKLLTKGFDDFILEIFWINNVDSCYQQTKFSKYPKKLIIITKIQKILYYILIRVLTLWTGYALYTCKIERHEIFISTEPCTTVAQPLNICLLYLTQHEHIYLPMLFFSTYLYSHFVSKCWNIYPQHTCCAWWSWFK